MKNQLPKGIRAFTLTELLVVIVITAVLASLFLAARARAKAKSTRIKCVGNLKLASLSLKIFASDNDDRYPYQILPPMTNAAPKATISLTNAVEGAKLQSEMAAWAHWSAISNELGSPKILLCPHSFASSEILLSRLCFPWFQSSQQDRPRSVGEARLSQRARRSVRSSLRAIRNREFLFD